MGERETGAGEHTATWQCGPNGKMQTSQVGETDGTVCTRY